MAIAVRRLGHAEEIGLVDHLEELRRRLIVSLAVLGAAFAVCLWQNHALLHIVNKPLASQTQKQVRAGHGASYTTQRQTRAVATSLAGLLGALERPHSGASAATRASLRAIAPAL